MSRSKSDLFKDVFVSLEGTSTDYNISYNEYLGKLLSPQGIYREILPPDMMSGSFPTPSGFTGMFNNGIELLNYKSQNSVYYGDIQNINITKGGSDYDIINPPVLDIQDEVGTGAGTCNVIGSLFDIQIIDPGLGYKEPPILKITGGNGRNHMSRSAKLVPITYSIPFNALIPSFNKVNLTSNVIASPPSQNSEDGEELIYEPKNPGNLVGLNTDQRYFLHIIADNSITLHLTQVDKHCWYQYC